MTRSELIDAVAESRGIERATAERVVRAIFDAMTDALARGEGIELRGLGSFVVRSYKSYLGRNPRNGEPVEVRPKRLPHFKVGKPLRARIEGEGDGGDDGGRKGDAAVRHEPVAPRLARG